MKIKAKFRDDFKQELQQQTSDAFYDYIEKFEGDGFKKEFEPSLVFWEDCIWIFIGD